MYWKSQAINRVSRNNATSVISLLFRTGLQTLLWLVSFVIWGKSTKPNFFYHVFSAWSNGKFSTQRIKQLLYTIKCIYTSFLSPLLPSGESAKNGRIRLELYSGAGPGDSVISKLADIFGTRGPSLVFISISWNILTWVSWRHIRF